MIGRAGTGSGFLWFNASGFSMAACLAMLICALFPLVAGRRRLAGRVYSVPGLVVGASNDWGDGQQGRN